MNEGAILRAVAMTFAPDPPLVGKAKILESRGGFI